ncbi:MAG: rubrerythrin [Sporomusaceae bacterium]|nr:rubrerythrin [Sporomusaceae bacterium]
MKKYVRCKACGYIMEEGALHDVCPVCGLPKTVFEPYTKKLSPNRRLILDQHLHPVEVHFPQVFVAMILLCLPLSTVVGDPLRSDLLSVVKISILLLPFGVLGAFLTGLLDAKVRFKKLNAPLLVKKMIFGCVLQVISCIIFGVYWTGGLSDQTFWPIEILTLAATACAIYLGRAGSGMFDSFIAG